MSTSWHWSSSLATSTGSDLLNVIVRHCIWAPVVLTFNLHISFVTMVVWCQIYLLMSYLSCVHCVEVHVMKVGHGKTRCSAPVTPFCSKAACQVATCKKWVGSNPLICHRRSPRYVCLSKGHHFVSLLSCQHSPWKGSQNNTPKILKTTLCANYSLSPCNPSNVPLNHQV